VITDHSNLQFLNKASTKSLVRWAQLLQEHPFMILHQPGESNAIADCISRM